MHTNKDQGLNTVSWWGHLAIELLSELTEVHDFWDKQPKQNFDGRSVILWYSFIFPVRHACDQSWTILILHGLIEGS